MEKDISHEEKLEFYKTYNSEEFQNKLHNIKGDLFPVGYLSLKLCFVAAILGGIFNPWLCFIAVPGIITPFTVMAIGNYKQKKLIESINPNITHKDFIQMQKSGEWALLGQELSAVNINKPDSETKQNVKENSSKLVVDKQAESQPIKIEELNENQKQSIYKAKTLIEGFLETFFCKLISFKPVSENGKIAYIVQIKTCDPNFSPKFKVTKKEFAGIEEFDYTDLTEEWKEFIAEQTQTELTKEL